MPLGMPEFNFIQCMVRQHAAIVVDPGKEYLVESRLLPLARREGFGSVAELVAHLRARPHDRLHGRVVEAMTTNETSFFRDHHPFEALRREVLPALLRDRARRPLQIWSAACSSGQEPYSIAILLREDFPQLNPEDVRILATDLSGEVLDRARRARFTEMELKRGLPAPLAGRYFRPRDGEWEVREDVRRLVEFRQLNLAKPWPPVPEMDVIFLRNVLIYFDLPTRREVLARVRGRLRPDGCLFLGGAETTLHLDDTFDRVQVGAAGFYRMRGVS